jgi:tRNA-dependent cyclodipeptide synthase
MDTHRMETGFDWQQIEWGQLTLDDLTAVQRKVRTAIDSQRKLQGKQRLLESALPSKHLLPEPLYQGKERYRTLVNRVAPAQIRSSLDKLDGCMLGISLGGGNAAAFQGAKLEAIVRWIASRARRCSVLVGDSLGRISLQVREGMDPETAEREARALGQRYATETEALFRRYTSETVTFEFKFGTEYAKHPCFEPYLANVRALYEKDAAFQQLVHDFGDMYLQRTATSIGEARLTERWQQLAREYLIEEIALLACLAADGWTTLVYPGSIDSIIEIAEGRYPALPASLKDLGFVALWLDSKSGAR